MLLNKQRNQTKYYIFRYFFFFRLQFDLYLFDLANKT